MAVRIETHAEPIPGYRLISRIGSGGFGDVWKAEAPGGIFKAIKIIHGDLRSENSDAVRYAEQELKSLKRVKQVRHPYLLALDRYDIVDGRLMIVMELADCNLWERYRACRDQGLSGIPRDELLLYMLETAEVLDLFNDQFQLQHLDIKPQNLFLLHNHVKVADFGQVKDLQGFTAQVTGGITPVYAAPETFDGVITRFCDQYSLACVYQELLTGVRPFDGNSINQLFMQHLNLPPNLDPSPASDRSALSRALAKSPEDRWPTVSDFVRGMITGPATGRAVPDSATRLGRASGVFRVPGLPSAAGPTVEESSSETPQPLMAEPLSPVSAFAPPESAGPGSLQPSLVIGIGQGGLRVLQRLRFDLGERYGPPETIPLLRTLYVDTDPEALEDSTRSRPQARRAGLRPNDVFAAKLNRASHYLKPRYNSQTLTEGWFDPQLLYKIPRAPLTMGVRLFGRLAFCDHYRSLLGRVQAELEAALSDDALARTQARTGLAHRTNRPRVYIVTSLAGGTGGGMFLDMAYAVRSRLRRMGYEHPELVGVLIVPPADPSVTPPQWLGNTYAALTELHHYSRPDTIFTANYDEQSALVRERAAPFSHCFLLTGRTPSTPSGSSFSHSAGSSGTYARPRTHGSGTIAKPGSRADVTTAAPVKSEPASVQVAFRPYGDAAELIRLNLFTPVGRTAAEKRLQATDPPPAPRGVTFATFGLSGFGWPRAEIVDRTTAQVGRAILARWAAPDPQRSREVMPRLAQQRWSQMGLDADAIVAQLHEVADGAAGGNVEAIITELTDPLLPRGWLARLPDPALVSATLERFFILIGPPSAPGSRTLTAVEEAINSVMNAKGTRHAREIHNLVPTLANDPQYRLSGAEELIRQFLVTTDRLLDSFGVAIGDLDTKAQAAYDLIALYAHYKKGLRKPAAAEFAEAIKTYPHSRYQSALYRGLTSLYQTVREALVLQLNDVTTARQRLEAAAKAASTPNTPEPAVNGRRLMPPGCATLDAAVSRFVGAITDTEMGEIDRRIEDALDPQLHGLFLACLRSASGPERVVETVYQETRAYLEARLGEADLAAMFRDRFQTPQQAEKALEDTYHDAESALPTGGACPGHEVAVVGCPAAPGGEPLRELARRAIPVAGLPIVDTPDELTVYRQWSAIPFSAIPHLGPDGAAAFQALTETQQCPAYSRLDVIQWYGPEDG
jgi:serine/threonine protein kinase